MIFIRMLRLELFFLNIHYQIIVALYRQWNTIYVLKLAQNFRYLIFSFPPVLKTNKSQNFVYWFSSKLGRLHLRNMISLLQQFIYSHMYEISFCTVFLVTLLLYIGLCKQLAFQIYICEFTSFNKNTSDYILFVRRCRSLLLQFSNRTTKLNQQ